ncbi:MAG: enoyl-CoA hydratase-related protein [Myxococcota bacterium]|jgi:enoyl-CoA hydratase/carnithine racemase|nr:enoyl-CoA hydratase-related protein [Myxococcota bacterium]
MDYQDILFEQESGVVTLTLNRPEHMNTFSGRMGSELSDAYRRCDADDSVRAVVLTGAGQAFCAGADMTAGSETFASQAHDAAFSSSPLERPAWEVRKPVIAALNGHAIGIGLNLALQCDLRFVAQEGKYGVLQVRRGVMPDCQAHWTLPRLVGMAKAADILLTGRKFEGEEAVRLGIASLSLPREEVLPHALGVAREIAEKTAPISVAVTKKLLWQSSSLGPDEVEHYETQLHHHLMGLPDAAEGVMAFLERRPPRWTGNLSEDWPEWPDSEEPD